MINYSSSLLREATRKHNKLLNFFYWEFELKNDVLISLREDPNSDNLLFMYSRSPYACVYDLHSWALPCSVWSPKKMLKYLEDCTNMNDFMNDFMRYRLYYE